MNTVNRSLCQTMIAMRTALRKAVARFLMPGKASDGAETGALPEQAEYSSRCEPELSQTLSPAHARFESRTTRVRLLEQTPPPANSARRARTRRPGLAPDERVLEQDLPQEDAQTSTTKAIHDLFSRIARCCDHVSAGPVDPIQHARVIQEIVGVAYQGMSLTAQWLFNPQVPNSQPTSLDPGALATGMTEMLQSVLGDAIDLVMRIEPGVGRIQADANRLQQAIVHMAMHSRDALPQGGTLTMEIQNVLLEFKEGSRRAFVMLGVSESGPSTSDPVPSATPYVPLPIRSTKEVGLGAVRDFVQDAGGFLQLAGKAGEGGSVRVYLPQIHDNTINASGFGPARPALAS